MTHGRPAKQGRVLRRLPAVDLPFLVLVLTLVAFGLVMLYSASSAVAMYRRGDAYAYIRPQLLYAALGLGAMWAASRVDYHLYHKLPGRCWGYRCSCWWRCCSCRSITAASGGWCCRGWGRAAQRDRKMRGGACVCPYHIPEPEPDAGVCRRGAALCFGTGHGGGADAAGASPFRYSADTGDRGCAVFVGGTGLKWFCLRGRRRRGDRCGGGGNAGSVPYAASRLSSWIDPFATPWRRPPDDPELVCDRFRRCSRAGAGQQPAKASVRAGTGRTISFFHRLRGAGFCGSLRGDPVVCTAAVPGHHLGSPCAGPLWRIAGGGLCGTGGAAGGAEYCGGHQHHPEHRASACRFSPPGAPV